MTTRGIEIGKTSILMRGQTLKGTKYVPRQDGSGVDLIKVVCILFFIYLCSVLCYVLHFTVE